MAVLLIEGNLEKLEALRNELIERYYFGGVLNAEIIEIPNLVRYSGWRDFLYQLDFLVRHYRFDKLPFDDEESGAEKGEQ